MNLYILFKDDGTPFYVGAGNDRRIANHFSGCGGRPLVDVVIKEHRLRGSEISFTVVESYVNDDEAYDAEVNLISLIGKEIDGGTLVNITDGGKGVSGYKSSPKQISDNSKRGIVRFSDPHERSKISIATREAMADPKVRKNISDKLLAKWQDPDFINKQVASHTGIKDTVDTKVNKSKACTKSWSEGRRKGKYTDEQVKIIYMMKGYCDARDAALIYGMNPTYVHKIWRHERCKMALIRLGYMEA